MPQPVIISRHPAAVEFLANHVALELHREVYEILPDRVVMDYVGGPDNPHARPASYDPDEVPQDRLVVCVIRGDATPADVEGNVVFGNVPMHLACLAGMVCVVEFTGAPPRGQEYTADDMKKAGARVATYVVRKG